MVPPHAARDHELASIQRSTAEGSAAAVAGRMVSAGRLQTVV